jgi:hypothetical protein
MAQFRLSLKSSGDDACEASAIPGNWHTVRTAGEQQFMNSGLVLERANSRFTVKGLERQKALGGCSSEPSTKPNLSNAHRATKLRCLRGRIALRSFRCEPEYRKMIEVLAQEWQRHLFVGAFTDEKDALGGHR